MEFTNIHFVAAAGFALAMVLGAVMNRTNFCTMGAVSDWVNMGLNGRFAAWVLAMGIAVAGTQILELSGLVDLQSSIYRTANFTWLGYVVGGLLFGIGMTLAGGCGQRSLVRLGSGNLKSLVVVLVLGITAYATLRGILGLLRVNYFDPFAIDLNARDLEGQGLATLFGADSGGATQWLIAAVIALLLIGWALRQPALRTSADNLAGGIVTGLCVVGAWWITGVYGLDDFDPVPVESLTFIAPTGNAINYAMTFTGATINFGIAVALGMIAGSFVYAVLSRNFRIETFTDRSDMCNHLIGAVLMGFGGVLAMGCTIGQGVSGVSTLAAGSFIAIICIVIGCALTLKVQYHMMDDCGFWRALIRGAGELLMPWRAD